MKKIVFTLFLFSVSMIAAQAQQTAVAYFYKGKFNSKFGRGDAFRDFQGKLIISGDRSLFTMKEEGLLQAPIQEHTIDLRPDSMFTVYKEMGSASLLFEFSDLSQRTHVFADTLFPMEWVLKDEEKMIEGIPCRKAVSWFKGRGYCAWYAPSITNADGPWKLGGLPGMILEAYDDDDQWHMTYVGSQPSTGFDEEYFEEKIRKGVEGFQGYATYLKKMFSRLEANFNAQAASTCIGCTSKSTIKYYSWEKID